MKRLLQGSSCHILWAMALWILSPAMAAGQHQYPKIGLALSVGGARAASHIGVLKVFEKEHIPIDCIAGTSFGALVGGLYSMGYSVSEIEDFFTQQDWNKIFSNAPKRSITPLIERKDLRYQGQISFKGWRLELPSGLWEGQRLTEALALFSAGPMLRARHDFDNLPIQFRAVATNLVDGSSYIFKQGPMTDALRASISVPLIFTPLEKDGMLLADGGLVDNLPTDIVRKMDAEIIIAVDATSPLLQKDEIRTFLDVIDQSISLQMNRNVQENRILADILLQPDLEEYTSSDYDKLIEIIERGEKEATRQLAGLRSLVAGIPYRPHSPAKPGNSSQTVDSVSFQGLKHIKPAQLKRNVRARLGEPIDPAVLEGDVGRLYATGLFDRVEYTLEPLGEGRYHLIYKVKESPHNNLGGSLRFDNSYQFVGLAEFTAQQLFNTPSSMTISSQFGGLDNHYAAFRFVPAFADFLFLEPKVYARRQERLDIRDQVLLDTFIDKREGVQAAMGASFLRQLEITAGYRYERIRLEGGSLPNRLEGSPKGAGFALGFRRDSLDSPEFPFRGMNMRIQVEKLSPSFGGDLKYSRLQADYEHYFPISNKSTLQIRASTGFSQGSMPFYDAFFIGGYPCSEMASRQFLGLKRDELLVRQMVVLGSAYRRQIFSKPLSFFKRGFLTGSYNGAYYSGRQESPYDFQYLSGGGIGFALDTMLGPIRAIAGWSEGGRFNYYISLGPSF